MAAAKHNRLLLSPLHSDFTLAFVRSGWVNVSTSNSGGVRNVGENGNGWSRTANSSTNAYNLNFNPTGVNPSNNSNRWAGLPLR